MTFFIRFVMLSFLLGALQPYSHAQLTFDFAFSDPDVSMKLETEAEETSGTYSGQTLDAALSFTLTLLPDLGPEEYDFDGIASYYNARHGFIITGTSDKNIKYVKRNSGNACEGAKLAGFKGRFDTVLIDAPGAKLSCSGDTLTATWPIGAAPQLHLLHASMDRAHAARTQNGYPLSELKYSQLPRWLAWLCEAVERLYRAIVALPFIGWGTGLILFAIAIRIILVPISWWTANLQKRANAHKTILDPVIASIKSEYQGEDAHRKIMAAHRALGISPAYTLIPMVGTLIQIPILIAIFNMLAEHQPLDGLSFLWVDSLADPDHLFTLPFTLPLMGDAFNLMPFFMAGVTVFSTVTHSDSQASSADLKRQRRTLYWMAIAFFLLFYTFPAGLVLYWALANLAQWVQSRFIKL